MTVEPVKLAGMFLIIKSSTTTWLESQAVAINFIFVFQKLSFNK